MNIALHYITVATKPHCILDKLVETTTNENIHMHVLGKEENRWIGWQSKGNFGIKLKSVYDFLQNREPGTLSDLDIVLFTDAYDVICCGKHDEIISRYEKLDMPIIFGAEKQCNPDPWRADNYGSGKNGKEFPFLNSGMFIGRVWALRLCMLSYKYNDNDDDQRFWTTQFLEHPFMIGLDYKNDLFLNTADIDMGRVVYDPIKNRAFYNSNTGFKNPLFIHVNGPDKNDLHLFL